MTKVKKRDGRLEEFKESKIVAACKKAGATARQASDIAKDVSAKVVGKVTVTAEEISKMVVKSLKEVNKNAAGTFVKFKKKLSRKK